MTTVTISLPDTLAQQLDTALVQGGFATRSEFVRSLVRRHLASDLPLEPFQAQPLASIKRRLTQTGKYSPKFVNSVTRGLAKSSAYAR
ncbi:MAG: hypothetical protein HY381_01585 [Candidatus Chisholmbacteria bacterium]|nr:hypothetical protein [Candidatus Chisholmbacteria bacterium]